MLACQDDIIGATGKENIRADCLKYRGINGHSGHGYKVPDPIVFVDGSVCAVYSRYKSSCIVIEIIDLVGKSNGCTNGKQKKKSCPLFEESEDYSRKKNHPKAFPPCQPARHSHRIATRKISEMYTSVAATAGAKVSSIRWIAKKETDRYKGNPDTKRISDESHNPFPKYSAFGYKAPQVLESAIFVPTQLSPIYILFTERYLILICPAVILI
jgi:hypothetical protein